MSASVPRGEKNRNVQAVVGRGVRAADTTRKDTCPDDQVLLWLYYADSGTVAPRYNEDPVTTNNI